MVVLVVQQKALQFLVLQFLILAVAVVEHLPAELVELLELMLEMVEIQLLQVPQELQIAVAVAVVQELLLVVIQPLPEALVVQELLFLNI
jgi:hypothetical protein